MVNQALQSITRTARSFSSRYGENPEREKEIYSRCVFAGLQAANYADRKRLAHKSSYVDAAIRKELSSIVSADEARSSSTIYASLRSALERIQMSMQDPERTVFLGLLSGKDAHRIARDTGMSVETIRNIVEAKRNLWLRFLSLDA